MNGIIDKYFRAIFFSVEIFLFLVLMIKILFIKFLKSKKFTTAGICYFISAFFFLLYGVAGVFPILYGDQLGIFAPAKSFLFITALVYLQLYFYKMSKNFTFKLSTTIATRNYRAHTKAKTNLYTYSILLYVIEALCVPVFSNSRCYIRFYEIIPAICLTIFLIYQLNLLPKIQNSSVVIPWIIYTIFLLLFLCFRFLIENLIIQNIGIVNLIGVFFRTAQLVTLGYISFIRNDDLEVSLV